MNKILTIITPVYNRAGLIKNLYESLKKQINKKFVWLIVDDGSTDEITDVVKLFTKNSDFTIEFYQKPNGGKHTALNFAFSKLETELAIIVDSDDRLISTATDLIEQTWCNRADKDVAGCIFLKEYQDGSIVGKSKLSNGSYDMISALFSHHIKEIKQKFLEVIYCQKKIF